MRFFFKVILFFTLLINLSAQGNIPLASFENIPDSSRLRKSIAHAWLLQDVKLVQLLPPMEYTDGSGKRFSVESFKDGNVLEVRIIPYDTNFYSKNLSKAINVEKEAENNRKMLLTESQSKSDLEKPETTKNSVAIDKRSLPKNLIPFSFDGKNIPQGTWVLRRDIKTGEPISITIYLRESSDVFLVLHPVTLERISDKSLIDFCVFSAYVRRDVPISFNFNDLYYTSLVELKERTKSILPWNIFNAPESYSTVEETSRTVFKKMQELVYMDDGAFDENGNPCYISNGKFQTKSEIQYACEVEEIKVGQKIRGGVDGFGFVKWIIDGIIRPVAGSNTYINSLKKPTDVPNTNFTESYILKRQMFFGLDWIRNLASARLSLTMKKTVYPYEAGIDVKVEPFSFSKAISLNDTNPKKFSGYLKPAGYQIEYLKALLYYLAITEPNNFYLASINYETGNPSLRQYNHVVAIFPYFDLLGSFHVDIYENATRVPLDQFVKQNENSFITLVRIKSPEIGFYQP